MIDPTLTCPNCRTEIKLTESLAAPLIADTRSRYETQLAQKEAEVAAREAAIRVQQEHVASGRPSTPKSPQGSTGNAARSRSLRP
jgi:hypothetical protein